MELICGNLPRMIQSWTPHGCQGYPSQQRYTPNSEEWHECTFWYTEEEIKDINLRYGWEKYRLVPEHTVEQD